MPGFPSSQTKARAVSLQQKLKAIEARAKVKHLSLSSEIRKLKTLKSNDPIQQLQSDIIIDLYELVRELQLDLFPSLLGLPDVQDVRDAFGGG